MGPAKETRNNWPTFSSSVICAIRSSTESASGAGCSVGLLPAMTVGINGCKVLFDISGSIVVAVDGRPFISESGAFSASEALSVATVAVGEAGGGKKG